jgi:hypothetical protein
MAQVGQALPPWLPLQIQQKPCTCRVFNQAALDAVPPLLAHLQPLEVLYWHQSLISTLQTTQVEVLQEAFLSLAGAVVTELGESCLSSCVIQHAVTAGKPLVAQTDTCFACCNTAQAGPQMQLKRCHQDFPAASFSTDCIFLNWLAGHMQMTCARRLHSGRATGSHGCQPSARCGR